jgi:hypothetical protein
MDQILCYECKHCGLTTHFVNFDRFYEAKHYSSKCTNNFNEFLPVLKGAIIRRLEYIFNTLEVKEV